MVVEVFGLSRPELGDLPWYELRVCAEEPGRELRAVGGFTLRAEHGLDVLAAADTVIVPGVGEVGPGGDRVTQSMNWALLHSHTPLSVPALARAACMSERSYARHFTRRNGVSPMRWVIAQRVAASLPLLESGEGTVDEVAAAVGFDSTATYRHHFTRRMHTTPTAYRKAFTRAPAHS